MSVLICFLFGIEVAYIPPSGNKFRSADAARNVGPPPEMSDGPEPRPYVITKCIQRIHEDRYVQINAFQGRTIAKLSKHSE